MQKNFGHGEHRRSVPRNDSATGRGLATKTFADYDGRPEAIAAEHRKRQGASRYDDSERVAWIATGIGGYEYPVDFERFTDPAGLLDIVLQVGKKNWPNKNAASELLACLQEACWLNFGTGAQGVYCPCGVEMRVDWKTGKSVRAHGKRA